MTCPRCRGLLRRDDDGVLVCWACGRATGLPPFPPAVPSGLTPFRDVPAALPEVERKTQHAAILRALLAYPGDTQQQIAERVGVARSTVGLVAGRYRLGKRFAVPTEAKATYREQQRRLVVGKPEGKMHVAPVRGGLNV